MRRRDFGDTGELHQAHSKRKKNPAPESAQLARILDLVILPVAVKPRFGLVTSLGKSFRKASGMGVKPVIQTLNDDGHYVEYLTSTLFPYPGFVITNVEKGSDVLQPSRPDRWGPNSFFFFLMTKQLLNLCFREQLSTGLELRLMFSVALTLFSISEVVQSTCLPGHTPSSATISTRSSAPHSN